MYMYTPITLIFVAKHVRVLIIGFQSHTLRHLFIQFVNMCFQFRPGHSGMCETRFRQSQFKFVGHSIADYETAKSISSIGINFRQSFTQISSPRYKV